MPACILKDYEDAYDIMTELMAGGTTRDHSNVVDTQENSKISGNSEAVRTLKAGGQRMIPKSSESSTSFFKDSANRQAVSTIPSPALKSVCFSTPQTWGDALPPQTTSEENLSGDKIPVDKIPEFLKQYSKEELSAMATALLSELKDR